MGIGGSGCGKGGVAGPLLETWIVGTVRAVARVETRFSRERGSYPPGWPFARFCVSKLRRGNKNSE